MNDLAADQESHVHRPQKSIVSNIAGILIGVLAFGVMLLLSVALLLGWAWIIEKILPWVMRIVPWVFVVDVVVVIPALLFPKLRDATSTVFAFSSLIYAVLAFFLGFILTIDLWGGVLLVIGLLVGGFGVVITGFLATLFNAMWLECGVLTGATVLYFASSWFSMYLEPRNVSTYE